MEKYCSGCHLLLPATLDNFYKDKSCKNGIGSLCHECNITIGKVKESSSLLRDMANYIDYHSPDCEVPVGWC